MDGKKGYHRVNIGHPARHTLYFVITNAINMRSHDSCEIGDTCQAKSMAMKYNLL